MLAIGGVLEAVAVTLALAIAGAIVVWPGAATAWLALAVPIGVLAFWIAWQDLDDFTIPDGAVLALAILGITARLADATVVGERIAEAGIATALDMALAGGGLMAVREIYFRRRGWDGIGLGDVKLAAAGGALVGAIAFAWALLAASLAGLLFVALARARGQTLAAVDRLAFGALLAPALWTAWIVGPSKALAGLAF